MNNEFDFTIFGDDADTIRDLIAKPEDVHKLLLTKRSANGEAKQFREQFELSESERQAKEAELERISDENRRALSISHLKIQALKEGIRPDRLSAAVKLVEADAEKPETAVSNLREMFPELFIRCGSPPNVDNSGFSRGGSDDFEIAKAGGDVMGMLKSLREGR
ncbi:MAG TPA: hypothetical protein ENN75_01125 [candidate division Zixibacteria bacterium]|nr:hypothetical protein [candidate division Zixibacteria bacterium]